MKHLISQCWYFDLELVRSSEGSYTKCKGFPVVITAPIAFDRILLFRDNFVLMQRGKGELALFSWGRKEAIECEGKPLYPQVHDAETPQQASTD